MGDPKVVAFLAFGAALVLRLGLPIGTLPELSQLNAIAIDASVNAPQLTDAPIPIHLPATPTVGFSGVLDSVPRLAIDDEVTMTNVPSNASEPDSTPTGKRGMRTTQMPETTPTHPLDPVRSHSTVDPATPTAPRRQAVVSPRAASIPAPRHSVTSLVIPRIGLRTEVVLAPFVREGNDLTWEVPPFRVGYAQYTAGAGEPGNTVLIGHVSSRGAGSVFHNLDVLRLGDVVRVSDGVSTYDYTVTETRIVSRTDVSVVQWTPTATVTLITCAGAWSPQIDDYASRLVVRGVLIVSPRQPVLH